MKKSATEFVALVSGEKPGDPELGGWRSLPARLFTVSSSRASAPWPQQKPDSQRPALKEAVELVALSVRAFTLKQAVVAIASRLSDWKATMAP